MTPTESAALALADRAVLWRVGEIPAADVVTAACDALVAGLDTPALRILAACTRDEATYDVHDLLPPALRELGLAPAPAGRLATEEAAVRALARRLLAGEMTPAELTARVHLRFGHAQPLAARLALLDDEYGMLEHSDVTEAELDAEVRAEARRLASGTGSGD
jgi:hypothetical protein